LWGERCASVVPARALSSPHPPHRHQVGFAWTNGVALDLLIRFGFEHLERAADMDAAAAPAGPAAMGSSETVDDGAAGLTMGDAVRPLTPAAEPPAVAALIDGSAAGN
jgi:hypothetical protein